MGILTRDTERSAERKQIEILRAMPASRKLELLCEACEANRTLMLAGLRSRYPDSSDDQLNRLLMGLLWGEARATLIWGPLATH